MAQIVMASIGIATEEALLVRWVKEAEQAAVADETIAESKTDRTDMEVTTLMSESLGATLSSRARDYPLAHQPRLANVNFTSPGN